MSYNLKTEPIIATADDLRRICQARLAKAPTDAVFSAHHIPARGDHDLNDLNDDKDIEAGLISDKKTPKPAAVLVPIIARPAGLSILLTERQKDLNSHGGQISFPGGKVEQADNSPLEAALRETHEEVGIEQKFVELLGFCDDYQTVTGYRIVPVVGLVGDGFALQADPGEVANIFEVPFEFLMDTSNHRKDSLIWQGKRRHYFAMPFKTHYIWGATAGILKNLHERLYG